eukprot:jgi/Chrzof1/7758/Cz02g35200.t1
MGIPMDTAVAGQGLGLVPVCLDPTMLNPEQSYVESGKAVSAAVHGRRRKARYVPGYHDSPQHASSSKHASSNHQAHTRSDWGLAGWVWVKEKLLKNLKGRTKGPWDAPWPVALQYDSCSCVHAVSSSAPAMHHPAETEHHNMNWPKQCPAAERAAAAAGRGKPPQHASQLIFGTLVSVSHLSTQRDVCDISPPPQWSDLRQPSSSTQICAAGTYKHSPPWLHTQQQASSLLFGTIGSSLQFEAEDSIAITAGAGQDMVDMVSMYPCQLRALKLGGFQSVSYSSLLQLLHDYGRQLTSLALDLTVMSLQTASSSTDYSNMSLYQALAYRQVFKPDGNGFSIGLQHGTHGGAQMLCNRWPIRGVDRYTNLAGCAALGTKS